MGSIAQQGVPPEIQMDREGDGRYAVFAVHDENGNQKIDASMFGYKEPWGVSNNVRPDSRAPRFVESSVRMSPDRSLDLEVAIRK